MRRLAAIALLGALVALAAGCGSDDEPGGAGSGTPTPAPSATPSSIDDTLTYQRGGGFAGGIYRLEIQPDKTAVLTSPGVEDVSFTLTDDEYAALEPKLAGVDDDLAAGKTADYAPKATVADGIGHTVELGGGKLSWADGGDPPAELRALTDELSKLVDAHRRKP